MNKSQSLYSSVPMLGRLSKIVNPNWRTRGGLLRLLIGLGMIAFAMASQAATDATAILTAGETAFVGVAGLCVSIGTFFTVYKLVRKVKAIAFIAGGLAMAQALQAATDATAILTAGETAFVGVAGLCVSIGTFFTVYKLVRKVK